MSCLARALLCALLAGVCFERASALQVVDPASVENFDVRLNADRAPAGYLQRVGADRPSSLSAARAEQRGQGLARLRRDHDGIDLVSSPALGTPEVVARSATDEEGAALGPQDCAVVVNHALRVRHQLKD